MATPTNPLQRVLDRAIVAVIRAESPDLLVDVAEALVAGGVEVMEVTFTVPRVTQVLEKVASKLGSRVLLGAGTVLDSETARAAILAGAEFIVAPSVNLDVIALCRRYSKLVMPGALTPTEVVTAWQAGADIVKIFPSELTGPKYLKALHGPLPHVRLMPTGGVNLDTAQEFLKAGACALGIGGSLVDPQAVASGDLKKIESLARQYVEIVARFRAASRVRRNDALAAFRILQQAARGADHRETLGRVTCYIGASSRASEAARTGKVAEQHSSATVANRERRMVFASTRARQAAILALVSIGTAALSIASAQPGREDGFRGPPPPYPRGPSENEDAVIEKGFAFLEGKYVAPPYIVKTSDEGATLNGEELKCVPPEYEGYGQRGFGPPRGNRWRNLGATLRTQLSSNCVILSFADQPVISLDGAAAYSLLKFLTSRDAKTDRSLLRERLPSGLDLAVWEDWLKDYRPPPDLKSRAAAMVNSFDAAEKKALASIAATRRLNALAYPLSLCGMVVSVIAVGHLLGGRPHAGKPTHGADDSPEAISAFHWTLVVIALLSTLDIVWTLLAVQANQMRELNPFGSHLVHDPRHLIGYKIGATFPSLALLWLVRRYKRAQIAAWWICLILTILAFRWLTFNSLMVAA